MSSGTMRLVTTLMRLASVAFALVVFLLPPATSYAQYGDYLLGTLGTMTRYITHQGQQGVDLRVGDDFALEWVNTSEGQVFLFGWAALWDPFK